MRLVDTLYAHLGSYNARITQDTHCRIKRRGEYLVGLTPFCSGNDRDVSVLNPRYRDKYGQREQGHIDDVPITEIRLDDL